MPEVKEAVLCHHCGEECKNEDLIIEDKHFCCVGCKTVFELLQENDLCGYYDLEQHAGVSLKSKNHEGKFDYLQNPDIEAAILDFKSEKLHKVTLFLPAVHCSSCVWLLENFHKIKAGVLHSRLNFIKKELSLTYDPTNVSLKEIVELLATLGYEPLISLENTVAKDQTRTKKSNRLLTKRCGRPVSKVFPLSQCHFSPAGLFLRSGGLYKRCLGFAQRSLEKKYYHS